MTLQFVSNPKSAFYRSQMFSRVLAYATTHIQDCALKEKNNKRMLRVSDVKSMEQAKSLLNLISHIDVSAE